MKIEINHVQGTEDLTIHADGKRLTRPINSMFSHLWDESDLEKLLTEAQYRQFEKGKYEFNIADWKVKIIQGRHVPTNTQQLIFSASF